MPDKFFDTYPGIDRDFSKN